MIVSSWLGAVHTGISLIAFVAGAWPLLRRARIRGDAATGRVFVVATVLTCLTALGLNDIRTGLTPGHKLAIVTLAALALGWASERRASAGRASDAVATLAYTFAFFCNLVPGVLETVTRLPEDDPLFSRSDPVLHTLRVWLVVGSVVLVALQAVWLAKKKRPG